MGNRFRQTRRILVSIGIIAHLLWLASFFLLAHGAHAGAAASALIGLLLAMMVAPFDSDTARGPDSAVASWTGRIAFLLVVLWLMDLPELHSLLHAIMREEAFQDVRVITAVCLWAAGSGFALWRRLSRCDDRRIYRFLESGDRGS